MEVVGQREGGSEGEIWECPPSPVPTCVPSELFTLFLESKRSTPKHGNPSARDERLHPLMHTKKRSVRGRSTASTQEPRPAQHTELQHLVNPPRVFRGKRTQGKAGQNSLERNIPESTNGSILSQGSCEATSLKAARVRTRYDAKGPSDREQALPEALSGYQQISRSIPTSSFDG